jgi:hypothetical protein
MTAKRCRKFFLAVLAGLALILPVVAVAGPASASVTGYQYQEAYAYNYGASTFVQLHTTNTTSQVWINGTVSCTAYGGNRVTWCGVGGGNGTGTLDTGANFTGPGGSSYWFRFDLHANGTCTVRGNAPEMVPDTCFGSAG